MFFMMFDHIEIKTSNDLMVCNKHFYHGLLLSCFFLEEPWVNQDILTEQQFPANYVVHSIYILHGNSFSSDDNRQSLLQDNAFELWKWNLPM